jgi:hypothetical protein
LVRTKPLLGALNINRAKRSTRWPSVLGEIVLSEAKVKADSDGDRHWTAIQYQYSVNGVHYTASRISFGDLDGRSLRRAAVSETVKKYPPGKRVPVWYDPNDPSQAALAVGPDSRGVYTQFYVGLMFVVLCVSLSLWHLK